MGTHYDAHGDAPTADGAYHMMKKSLNQLLLHGVFLTMLSGLSLVAADRKPKVLGQAPQKIDPSYRKYNDFAQTLYEIKDPTDETIAEFKAAFEKDKQVYGKYKQCKTELDLLLQDKTALVEARKLMPAEKTEMPTEEETEKGETKTEQTPLPEKQQAPASESRPIAQPSSEPSKPIVTPSAPIIQPKPTLTESLISEPLIEPTKTPATTLNPEAIKNLAKLVAARKLGLPQKTSPQLAALLQKTVSGVPKQKPAMPTPEAQEQPAVLLAQEFAELKKAGITQPNKNDLQIVSYVQPTLFTEIVQPLMTVAKKESQESKARKVIETTIHVLPTFTPQTQKHVTDRMAEVLKLARDAEGIRSVITQMQELTQMMLNQRINTPMLKENLNAVGIKTIIPRVSDEKKPEQQTISFDMLKPIIFEVAWRGNLDFAKTAAIANTLADATALITRETDKFAPLAGTALVVAPNKESVHDITKAFAIKLDLFDIGMDTVQSRGRKLFKEIEDTRLTKGWAKNLTWALSLGTSTYRKPEQIIPEIITLYTILQTVGRETVYSIEQAEKNTLYLMDQQTQEQWQQGSLDMTPYIDNRQGLGYTHTKRNYATELEKEITALETKILEEIAYLGNTAIAKEMEDLLNQAKVPFTKYYARAQEEAAKQFEQNMKALPAPKITPSKPERPKQRTRLPGATIETTVKKPKSYIKEPIKPTITKEPAAPSVTPIAPEIKPTTPELAKPVEIEKPQKFEPIVTEATAEDIKTLPEISRPTAYDILNKSARQQIDDIKKEINKINILKNNLTDVESIRKNVENLSLEQMTPSNANEFSTLAQNLSQREDQIKVVTKIRELIATLESKSANELSGITEDLLDLLKTLPTDAYNELKTQFEDAATRYAMELIAPLTILINLHENIANNITQLEQMPDNLLETINILSELTRFIDENNKATLQNIFIGLCALYDATLSALFTPKKFSKTIAVASEETEGQDALTTYKELVGYVKEEFASRNYEEIVTNAYFTLLNEDTREKFRTGRYDLTKTNTVGLDVNGAYIYALPKETDVVIDKDTTIPTLTAINAKHEKQYNALLNQWYERINKNDIIQTLIDFKNNPNKTYTPEQLEEIKAAIKDLQGLLQKGMLPEDFFTDLRDATTESEAFKNAEANVNIRDKITALSESIKTAHETFKTGTPKVVKDIAFKKEYRSILSDIEDTVEDQRPALITELNSVLTPYNAYLTDVAASYTAVFKSLPDNAFNMGPQVEESIKEKTATIKTMSVLSTMLQELKILELLNTETDFKTLYSELLKGYGYILATFDALNAKLVDIAKVEEGSLFSFTDKNNKKDDKTYKTAQMLMQLLDLSSKLRSNYADKLLAPYFSQTTEMDNYTNGTLNVIDIGIENVGTKDTYLYARTQIKGYKQEADIIFPTGNHQQDYSLVIKKWADFIELNFKAAATRTRQKQVLDSLTNILDSTIVNINLQKYVGGSSIPANMQLKNIHNFKLNQDGEAIEYNIFDELTRLIKENNLNQTKTIARNIFNISTQITDDLINKIQQLKDDNALTEDITDKINATCGNSVALLDGLIYWIYTQTKENKLLNKTIISEATELKDGIQPLAEQTKKLLPYTSNKLLPLSKYASVAILVKKIGNKDIYISDYRYIILDTNSTANLKLPGAINYRGINLFQTEKELSEDIITKQINTLNALIQSFQAPAQQPTEAPKINPLSTGTALLKPTAESISEVPTTPIIPTKPKAPLISNNLQAELAKTENMIAMASEQIDDEFKAVLFRRQEQEYEKVKNDIKQNQPLRSQKEKTILNNLTKIQDSLRSLTSQKDINIAKTY